MNKIIIDATQKKIFLTIIKNDSTHNISYENSKTYYEKLIMLINEFLASKNLEIKDINSVYVNRGPGSYAGIRNSLSIAKAINLAKKIDYYCYSLSDFIGENKVNNANVPNLCKKYKVKKNLINPIYLS